MQQHAASIRRLLDGLADDRDHLLRRELRIHGEHFCGKVRRLRRRHRRARLRELLASGDHAVDLVAVRMRHDSLAVAGERSLVAGRSQRRQWAGSCVDRRGNDFGEGRVRVLVAGPRRTGARRTAESRASTHRGRCRSNSRDLLLSFGACRPHAERLLITADGTAPAHVDRRVPCSLEELDVPIRSSRLIAAARWARSGGRASRTLCGRPARVRVARRPRCRPRAPVDVASVGGCLLDRRLVLLAATGQERLTRSPPRSICDWRSETSLRSLLSAGARAAHCRSPSLVVGRLLERSKPMTAGLPRCYDAIVERAVSTPLPRSRVDGPNCRSRQRDVAFCQMSGLSLVRSEIRPTPALAPA